MVELTGSLSSIELGPLARFLSGLGKSGDLLVSRDHWIGQLSFTHGRLTAAGVEDDLGTPALEFICGALRGGDFEFSEGPPSLTNNLDSSTDALAQVERLTTSQTQSWFSEIPPPTAVPRVLKPTSSGAADVDATIAL